MNEQEAELLGLVLAGGKSKRMGSDKSSIRWHGVEQRYYVAGMLKPLCQEVYISYRKDQRELQGERYNTLVDSYDGIGPYGAILSAFQLRADAAWLVVASDLPLLGRPTLEYLISNRDPSAVATTFQSPYDGLPEPLITIWEPRGHALLLSYLQDGITCPRKALIRSKNVHILIPPNPDAMMNVNTPEDFARAEQIIMLNKI